MTQLHDRPFPLAGVRIIDLTNVIAGPVVTRVLGQLGAEVIKVEQPWGRTIGGIAMHRTDPNEPRPYNTGALFNEVNRTKLSIAVNLAQESGGRLLRELVSVSDVVIENFSPRVMRNLGLNFEALKEARPDLVMVSMPALGDDGPWANHISFGPGTDALAGLSDVTGYENGPPHKPGNFYSDQNSALHAATAIMAALWNRRRSGTGRHMKVVIREATMAVVGEFFVQYQLTGCQPQRMGNRDQTMAPHNVYRCKGDDAWVVVAVASDDEWHRFCRAIGEPDWCRDERFSTVSDRRRYRAELDELIQQWTQELNPYEVMGLLQGCGVRAGAVAKIPEILRDAHYAERGFIDRTEHPDAGAGRHPGLPWRFSTAPTRMGQRAPLFAEHAEWVLKDLLSLDVTEVAALRRDSVVPEAPVER